MEKRREKKKKKRHPIVGVTLLCTLLASLCAGALAWFQLNRYEAGLVEVCAVQQDSYVQLVLDQIRMRRDQKSRGEIEDILGSMDASSNKYWTFSRRQDMLFVKDVLETNKYKGFTTATYYVSDSARSFLEDIRVDRVSHAGIFIEDREYIASGGAFEYQGDVYRLCLLTNRSVLLDNNVFLGAKTELCALAAGMLLLFLFVPVLLAGKVRRLQLRGDRQDEAIEMLNQSLDRMNKFFSERDLHDTRRSLWSKEALPAFIAKLRARKAYPLSLALLRCSGETAARELLALASVALDRTVLRFTLDGNVIGLLFVQCDLERALESAMSLLSDDVSLEEFLLLSSAAERRKSSASAGAVKGGDSSWR